MAIYDIGIVIVNYNVRHFLDQCLKSIYNSVTENLKIEVWVVDNASLDGSVPFLREQYPDVHLIANDTNVGFSAANNQAIKQMQSEFVLLLNPDTVLEEDTLQQCHTFMRNHADAGALGVKMIDGAGNFLPESKRKVPNLWNSFCKLSYLSDIFPNSRWFSGYNLGYLSEDKTHEIEVLCGAFMFIRQATLDKTGLLDESFFMYGEDIDLSYRIIQAGFKIHYFPETSIIHFKGESTKKSSLNYVKTFYGAMHIYVKKHYGAGNAAMFARIISFAISIRALLSGFSRVWTKLGVPVAEGVIIWFLLCHLKHVWASYHFHNASYYDETAIDQVFIAYSLIWIFFLWAGGHYDEAKNKYQAVFYILLGTLIILLGYALLPESLRMSRVIILLGTAVAISVGLFSTFLSRLWGNYSGIEKSKANIAIVASKPKAEKLLNVIHSSDVQPDNVHFISVDNNTEDAWYTNTLDNLPLVVKTLKIDEVIYSSEDMSMKDIIKSMTLLRSRASFKIGGDDSLSIIGSSSRHQQGELYSLDVSYRLNQPAFLRYKRLLDIILAIICIPVFPVLWVLNAMNFRLIGNIFKVLKGTRTWVGYGGDADDYGFLPELRQGIIKYPVSTKVILYSQDHFKIMNMTYAKDYNLLTDLNVFWKNVYKLSNNN